MDVMRLQKYLARAGVASRRASETLITEGHVAVNGAVVTELGTKVDAAVDVVTVDGTQVSLPATTVTLVLNKPAGYVSTMHDPQGRPAVASLVPRDEYPGLFPVGRLDRDTTGLLLFTTDGALGHELLHPSHHVMKRYVALVEGQLSDRDVARLRRGVTLLEEDGRRITTAPAEVRVVRGREAADARTALIVPAGATPATALTAGTSIVELAIHEGRNRQVRRMLQAVGHPVIALHRESFGPLDLADLPRGMWRLLTEAELDALRHPVS